LSWIFLVAAHTAFDTGRVSEWVGFADADTKRGRITELVTKYLTKLYELAGEHSQALFK
jgi:hypothetical protein